MAVWIIIGIVVTCCLLVGLIVSSYNKGLDKSRALLSDRDLLLLLNSEPDRILSKDQLVKKSGLTSNQASSRLSNLYFKGMVSQMYSGMKSFYELKKPILQEDLVTLSERPFISIEDLFTLFDHFSHKMDLQDICVATGLPFKVIEREMKYFAEEGIVHKMTQTSMDGMTSRTFYTLQEAYKLRDENKSARFQTINKELEEIYIQEFKDEDFV